MDENMEEQEESLDIENLASSVDDGGEPPIGAESTEVPPAPEETVEEDAAPAVETQPPPPENSPEPASGASGESGEPAAGGDIEDLIKKYEDLPAPDDKAKDKGNEKKGKKEKAKKSGGKKIPVIPIAAVIGAVVIAGAAIFIFAPKPAPTVKVNRPKAGRAAKKTLPVPHGAKTPSAASSFAYKGAQSLSSQKKDGIETSIFETADTMRAIKLFYQKAAAEKGYEITGGKENNKTFNMSFVNGKSSLNISVVPHTGKNVIVVSRTK